MDRLGLLRKYQKLDTDGSPLPEPRTNRDYAAILGIHESQLSRYYGGEQAVGFRAMQGLAAAFPAARREVMAALGLVPTPEEVQAS